MFFDVGSKQFILNSLDYPRQNGIYFRAIASATGFPDSISAPVPAASLPGLNLASSAPRLPSTTLQLALNGPLADLYFLATENAPPNGVVLRVQTTTNPNDEFSWTDLNNGNSGHMNRSTNAAYPNQFILLANNLPSTQGIYFRVLASLSGFVDSISNIMGPFNLVQDVPPTVTIQPPAGLPGSGNGQDIAHPILVSGAFHFSATAQSNRQIRKLKLQVDGSAVDEFNGSNGGVDYRTTVVGDHLLQAFAIDDLGATARAGTGPVFVRVVSTAGSGVAQPAESGVAAAVVTGKTYTAVRDLGFWNNSSTWKDQNGQPGVPGKDDHAIIGSFSISLPSDVAVKALTLNGSTLINGSGQLFTLTVLQNLTMVSAKIQGPITIIADYGAKSQLLNSGNILFTGGAGLNNHGTFNILGTAGISGAKTIQNDGGINFGNPLSIAANAAVDPLAGVRVLQTGTFQNSGVVNSTQTKLLAPDGATLLASDGATVIAQGGGNVIAQGGGNIIAQGGGNIIAQGGGNIIAAGGGNIIAAGGGNVFQSSPSVKAAVTSSDSYVQDYGGETDVSGIDIMGPLNLKGGLLTGSGIIYGDITNSGGSISPGHSAGTIGVTGNFTQGAQGRVVVDDGGQFASQFDQLQVGGTASLGGTLEVRLLNGYVPNVLDAFSPLACNGLSGNFNSVSNDASVTPGVGGLLMTVNPAIPVAVIKFAVTATTVNKDAGHATVTVNRTGETTSTVTVNYGTRDGSANARTDYMSTLGSLRFGPGETTKAVQIPIVKHGFGPDIGVDRSFSLIIGDTVGGSIDAPETSTITIHNTDSIDANPWPDSAFFVRQHYLDFLAREPETAGFNAWLNVLNNCSDVNNNPLCDRVTVSQSFYGSPEFQSRGYFAIRFYRSALSRDPSLIEFLRDLSYLRGATPAETNAAHDSFAADFAQRLEFHDALDGLTNTQYVDRLIANSGVTFSSVQRSQFIADVASLGRAQVLMNIVSSNEFMRDANTFNRAFVITEYFGYLRRDPEPAGLNDWLNYLNTHPGDFRTMVNGFVNSIEYRSRFGP